MTAKTLPTSALVITTGNFLGFLARSMCAEITQFYAENLFVEKDNRIESHVLGACSNIAVGCQVGEILTNLLFYPCLWDAAFHER